MEVIDKMRIEFCKIVFLGFIILLINFQHC